MTNKTIIVLGLIGAFAIGSLAASPVADAISPVLTNLIAEVDTMQNDCPAGQTIAGFADDGTPVCVVDSIGPPVEASITHVILQDGTCDAQGIGWCPDDQINNFKIQHTEMKNRSIIQGNYQSASGTGDVFPLSLCSTRIENDTVLNPLLIISGCNAPADGSELHLVIINPSA